MNELDKGNAKGGGVKIKMLVANPMEKFRI